MKAILTFTATLTVVAAALASCSSPGPESTTASERSATEALALGAAAPSPSCALLDNPKIRSGMSAAFEAKLLRQCGRMPRTSPARASASGAEVLGPLATPTAAQAGGVDILVNDPANDGTNGVGSTQSETSTVANGSLVCVAFNDSSQFSRNGSFSAFAYSSDNGRTYTRGGAFPNGAFDANFGDPSLAVSARDNAIYYAALSSMGLSLWKSGDSCHTFQYVGPIHAGGGDDKELMAVDNTPSSAHYGRIYVGWTNFGLSAPDLNQVTYSDDGGATWSTPVSLPGSGVQGQGMWPAVAPNGDVYFALLNRAPNSGGTDGDRSAGPADVGDLQDQWLYKSTNGGASFTKMTNIATGQLMPEDATSSADCGREALKGDIRYLPSPQIVIVRDTSAPAGYVIHAVYSYDTDGTGPDDSNVVYRRSSDGGQTWSPEVILNDDGTSTDQFFAALGVSNAGALVVSWYDRRLDPTNNLGFDRFMTMSTDGGRTWSANLRVSDVTSPMASVNPNFDGLILNCYHGDYDQVAVSDNVAHVVWSDDRRTTATGPNPDVYADNVVIGPGVSVSPGIFEGGTPATGTVYVASPAPAGGIAVALSSSWPWLVTVPASVTIPRGATSTTYAITSNRFNFQTNVTITATFPGGVTATGAVTVLASPTVASLAVSPTTVTGGHPSTGTVTLSVAAPSGGSVVSLSSSAPAVATVPATLTIPQGATSGTFMVTTVGPLVDTPVKITASLHGVTQTASLTVATPPGNAAYDPVLKAPRCTVASSVCDTGPTLVYGRDSLSGGSESNQPNTLGGTCADGTDGTFHIDESLDRLKISTTDGSPLAAGATAKVDALVWSWGSSDALDVYFAPDANNPVWTFIATVPAVASQQLVDMSTSFTLPPATLPVIRATWRFSGAADACTTGSFDDHDDLVFVYGPGPCANLCSNPLSFSISGSYGSGNLGTGTACYETRSVVHGGNCGNFVSPRSLKVNGTTETCNGQNWSSLPAARNGGYCIQATAGQYPWAYFTAW